MCKSYAWIFQLFEVDYDLTFFKLVLVNKHVKYVMGWRVIQENYISRSLLLSFGQVGAYLNIFVIIREYLLCITRMRVLYDIIGLISL